MVVMEAPPLRVQKHFFASFFDQHSEKMDGCVGKVLSLPLDTAQWRGILPDSSVFFRTSKIETQRLDNKIVKRSKHFENSQLLYHKFKYKFHHHSEVLQ